MAVKPSSKVEAQRALRAQRAAQSVDPAAPARSRAIAIRAGLESFVATRRLIAAAFQDQDWVALGYSSWEAYCDAEFSLKSVRLTAEERNEAILAFASVGMTTREIGAATGTSKATASRALRASRVSDETKPPLVDALRGEIQAAAERTETSAASAAAANTDETSLPVGEPDVDLEAASTSGTQTPVDGPDVTPAGEAAASASSPAGAEIAPVPVGAADSPAAELIEPSHAGVPAAGVQIEERIEEEAVEPPVDTPAAGTALPGDDASRPLASESQQPGQDSPTGQDSDIPEVPAVATTGRSETNLHLPHGGVGGEAPGEPRPPVEPELEGGGILPPSSSSDPDEWVDPASALMRAFRSFVATTVMAVDTEAVAGMLTDAEVLDLHLMGEQIADCIERIKHATP